MPVATLVTQATRVGVGDRSHRVVAGLGVAHADLQSSDLTRLNGHCGAPATDFIEQVVRVLVGSNGPAAARFTSYFPTAVFMELWDAGLYRGRPPLPGLPPGWLPPLGPTVVLTLGVGYVALFVTLAFAFIATLGVGLIEVTRTSHKERAIRRAEG